MPVEKFGPGRGRGLGGWVLPFYFLLGPLGGQIRNPRDKLHNPVQKYWNSAIWTHFVTKAGARGWSAYSVQGELGVRQS